MLRVVGFRFLQMLGIFLIFVSLVFLLLQAQPGDITAQFLDPNIPAEARQQIVARLGLDGGVVQQWWSYIGNLVTGNLGVSFSSYPRPVIDIVAERLPRTLFLFTAATLLAYAIGFGLGKRLAWRRGGLSEHTVTVGGVLLNTVFYPWFAIIMILIFGSTLGWVPINGFLTPEMWRDSPYTANQVLAVLLAILGLVAAIVAATGIVARRIRPGPARSTARAFGYLLALVLLGGFWLIRDDMRPFAADIAHHSILPIVTLALVAFASVMLLTRSSMLETLEEDYILTAQAKGIPDREIRDRHAARNALLPVVTSFVLGLAFIIGGGVVTETVFSWPGMGSLLLNATVVEDVPLATGALAFVGVLALVGHLVVDVLYSALNPRVRTGTHQ